MKLLSWKDMPTGAIAYEPGNSVEVETGSWRSLRPEIDFSRCTHCMICWLFCPDSCFQTSEGKLLGIDYTHCKGCGICASECPRKCIDMVEERGI